MAIKAQFGINIELLRGSLDISKILLIFLVILQTQEQQETKVFRSTRHLNVSYTCQPKYTHNGTHFESG